MPDAKAESVVALAGRRIDRPGTTPPRFPATQVPAVREKIADLLLRERAVALVASAARGADIIGLEQAERLGLRRRVVLPFPPAQFRDRSVADCPGDWVSAFDRLVAAAASIGDLVVLEEPLVHNRPFAAANAAIIRESKHLASTPSFGIRHRLVAILFGRGKGATEETQPKDSEPWLRRWTSMFGPCLRWSRGLDTK
jgi:hypothetical protein